MSIFSRAEHKLVRRCKRGNMSPRPGILNCFFVRLMPYECVPIGPRFSGNRAPYGGPHFPPRNLHMGVPIGNSVPGLRPGPVPPPTFIIPRLGALVKGFLEKNNEDFSILVTVFFLIAPFPHSIEIITFFIGVC